MLYEQLQEYFFPKMKTVSFGVQLPTYYVDCIINKTSSQLIKRSSIDACKVNNNIVQKVISPNQLVYVIKEFAILNRFRQRVYRFMRALQLNILFHIVEPSNGGLIDHAWCQRALSLTWEKVETENLMSWLSTLGGAFSALGDSFEKCADRAGRISMYQMKLGLKSGDPSIISRCKLYYSISLIQKGRLRTAKNLILEEYKHAKDERKGGDDRLYKMCHGIWLKLQYTYAMRHKKRLQSKRS